MGIGSSGLPENRDMNFNPSHYRWRWLLPHMLLWAFTDFSNYMNSLYISNLYESTRKPELYETTGRLETTSNIHQLILLPQTYTKQVLPNAFLDDEKKAGQICTVMMGHKLPTGRQVKLSHHFSCLQRVFCGEYSVCLQGAETSQLQVSQ